VSDTPHSNRHFIVGVLVLLLGTVLLLDQLGVVGANKVFLFWPLILIYFGVNKFFGGSFKQRWPWFAPVTSASPWSRPDSSNLVGRFWGGFLILLGIAFQLQELGISHIRFETVWPVFLICVGILLIARKYERDGSRYGPPPGPPPPTPPPGLDSPPPPVNPNPATANSYHDSREAWRNAANSWPGSSHENNWSESSAPRLDEVNIFWGGRRRIITKNFMGGEIVSIFGGFNIDLREADFQGDSVQIEIATIFGGGEIRIPPNWSVALEAVGIFGGATDTTRHPEQTNQPSAAASSGAPPNPAPKKLIIKGVCIFGGMTLKN
jgi:hypothetical protein